RNDLTCFTNGQGVCLTELKGYQPAIGKFICQPRRPNSRIDKVRHMFHKLA
ncbi:elongation factor G, partial [Campylobacter coli]|nr:elongation factor G [Campylobacter coli]